MTRIYRMLTPLAGGNGQWTVDVDVDVDTAVIGGDLEKAIGKGVGGKGGGDYTTTYFCR